jgi:protein transport protein SEC20
MDQQADDPEDSTKTLRSTTNLYDTYTSLLEASGTIIKQLEKADWYDRLIIFAAFLFFLLCVGWIIKRRILDRVVGGVGWWVGGSFRLIGMGLGVGGKAKVGKVGQVGIEKLGQVGAGKVGRTPEGMGRVGLAGGREKVIVEEKEGPDISILDSAVPPIPSEGSAITPPDPGRDRVVL